MVVTATINASTMRFTVPCGTKCIVILLFFMFLIFNIKSIKSSTGSLKIGETVLWPHGIKLTKPDVSVAMPYDYNHEWDILFRKLQLPQGCNMIDIGANIGDTSLNMAAAAGGKGRVVAFEMGPPADILRININQNRQFHLDLHEVAVSDSFGTVAYQSASDGVNGGIPQDARPHNLESSYKSVKLFQYLQTKYSDSFIQDICFMKTDTEGHDITILEDLHPQLRPAIIWTEWFREYKFLEYDITNRKFEMEDDDFCTKQSAQLFQTAISLGYEIFKPTWPLQKMKGCANKHYEADLLLIKRSFIIEYLKKRRNKMDLGGYKINVVFGDSE